MVKQVVGAVKITLALPYSHCLSNFLKNEEEIGNKFQDVTAEPHLLPGTIQHASSQAAEHQSSVREAVRGERLHV